MLLLWFEADASHGSKLEKPAPKDFMLSLATPSPWPLQTFANSPTVTNTFSGHCHHLWAETCALCWIATGPCASASADFSMEFCEAQSCRGKLPFIRFSPTPALSEGASTSTERMNDGTNSNRGKTSKTGSCEERKCFVNLRWGCV